MGKGALYAGIEGKAHTIPRSYVGINGKAHKVRRIYIGDDSGKAKLIMCDCQYGDTELEIGEIGTCISSGYNYCLHCGATYDTGPVAENHATFWYGTWKDGNDIYCGACNAYIGREG